ncbi:hypothetical protein A0H81_05636 [Grifola frondosa]|uniref:Uncharacterized protein n=1 Tax=Grifola frondosa TaxID=5627 RepID=A0A1C7MCU9_GRIFR|nr:hypothetical protein A0H81_05636 [Grifola frondosa]
MDTPELESHVRHALALGKFWLSSDPRPRKKIDFQASSGTGVSDVQFLPGHDNRWLATVSKGIWSMISCWDIGSSSDQSANVPARKVADWCPKGAIFSGFVVNSDPNSDGNVATSVTTGGGASKSIEILSISGRDGERPTFHSICNIATTFRPINMEGNIITFSDDSSDTVVMNWKANTIALLRSTEDSSDQHFQYNRCLQVVFAYKSILIVRARSIELFPEPELRSSDGQFVTHHPIAYHSFGWVDGVSVSPQLHCSASGIPDPHEALSILVRAESDNPWSSDVHKLELYVLHPNFEYVDSAAAPISPYLFPPVHSTLSSPSVRGFLRCTDIILGQYGTAIWIQPRPSRGPDLTFFDVHSSETQAPERASSRESLAAAVFAGPLQRNHAKLNLGARMLWTQTVDNSHWTALDYDEEIGRIALGSNQGVVTVLELA